MNNTKYKKGVMGFDQMAMGIGILTIVVAMVLIVLNQIRSVSTIATDTNANLTLTNAATAVALYGNFFSIIVILGIFVGIIGLLYMVTRGTQGGGA